MSDKEPKPSKLLDMWQSKAVLIFIVSSVWFVKGRLDQLDLHEKWIQTTQPVLQTLVDTSTQLKTQVDSLSQRVNAQPGKVSNVP